ncbi:hypothetical protein ATZ33_00655 [Enterococcus silesiacus]|uniref:Uncharacterized protein n=1 Tax=Enterococcus silesiacus TaxID=332949 RepID=A0ABM5W4A3_9ENTE|nr:hypothetical protein [Enterococcus silesiacus]ALR99941.1 hypothetical protein ATZ33_00655 [Enterococcus silesiacus]
MGKFLKVVFFCSASIFLASCSSKEATVDDSKKRIDESLVQILAGSWKANSYDYGDYEIVYDKKSLMFNSEKLEIEYTEGSSVFTHQANDKTFHYIFEVKEEAVIVYPRYEVEQSGNELLSGGDLAPIELKKARTISQESILGRWKSVETDFPVYLQVRATFDPNKVDLLIAKTENLEDVETIPLTFESGKSELIYLNEDKTIRYSFSYYKETQMILSSSTNKEGVEGTARPWILERAAD